MRVELLNDKGIRIDQLSQAVEKRQKCRQERCTLDLNSALRAPDDALDSRYQLRIGLLLADRPESAEYSQILQTLPERAQANMSRAYQRSQEIRTRLNSGDGVSSAEKMKLNTELALLDLQLANLQKDLDNRTSMQDLAVKQRDYQNARLANEEQKLQLLETPEVQLRLELLQQLLELLQGERQ